MIFVGAPPPDDCGQAAQSEVHQVKPSATAELPEILKNLPAVKDAMAAAEADRTATRRALITGLAAVETQALEDYHKHEAIVAAATKAHAEALERLRKAANALQTAAHERSSASYATEMERSELEAALAKTADPQIAPFIREMWELEHITRRKGGRVLWTVEEDRLTGKKVTVTHTNKAPLLKRLKAIADARAAAEALLRQADQSGVEARLSELRKSLPPAE